MLWRNTYKEFEMANSIYDFDEDGSAYDLIEHAHQMADRGEAVSQCLYGYNLYLDHPHDMSEVYRYWNAAAEQGCMEAQYFQRLGSYLA